MFKWRTSLPALALAFTLVGSVLGITSTANAEGPQQTKIKLDTLYVEVPYSESAYTFNRVETSTEVRVEVINKDGVKVDAFGEIKDKNSLKSNHANASKGYYRDALVYKELQSNQFVTNRLYASLNLYVETSYAQINKINETYWTPSNSDGNWTLEERHSYGSSSSGKFPTTQVSITGTAVVQTKTAEYGGIQYDGIGWSKTQDGYYRKLISLDFTYSTSH